MPDIGAVHVDQALTQVSIAYKNLDYLADLLFPPSPVTKQSDKYFIYSRDRFLVTDDARRPGAAANEVEWTLSTDTYYAEGHALSMAIPDEVRSNADAALDIDADTTEQLIDRIYLQREILAASKALSPSVVTQHSPSKAWDNSQSTPITDVETAKKTIILATGKLPNAMLLGFEVFQKLRNHPSIVTRYGIANRAYPADLTTEQLAAAFAVDNVYVAKAIKNTANENAAEAMDFVWGKNALLFYSPGAVGRRVVSFGGQFRFQTPGSSEGYLVKRYRVEGRTADMVEVQLYHDLKVVAAGAAYLFDSCIS